jgi:hypothetical protein
MLLLPSACTQLTQLLALGGGHGPAQQLVAGALELADALHLRLHSHLVQHTAQEGACAHTQGGGACESTWYGPIQDTNQVGQWAAATCAQGASCGCCQRGLGRHTVDAPPVPQLLSSSLTADTESSQADVGGWRDVHLLEPGGQVVLLLTCKQTSACC